MAIHLTARALGQKTVRSAKMWSQQLQGLHRAKGPRTTCEAIPMRAHWLEPYVLVTQRRRHPEPRSTAEVLGGLLEASEQNRRALTALSRPSASNTALAVAACLQAVQEVAQEASKQAPSRHSPTDSAAPSATQVASMAVDMMILLVDLPAMP